MGAQWLDEVNERRLLNKGYTLSVIKYVGRMPKSEIQKWVTILMKSTPEKVSEINRNMVEE